MKKWLIAAVVGIALSVSAYACPLQFYPNPTYTLSGGYLLWNGRSDVVSTGVGKVITKYDVWFHPSLGNDKKPKLYKAGQTINITLPGIFQAGGKYISFKPLP
jgi:hypothetical protein